MMLLDKRQRAMLNEMGVRVWQPDMAEAAAPAIPATLPVKARSAIDSGAGSPSIHSAATRFDVKQRPAQGVSAAVQADSSGAAWRVGPAQALYAGTTGQTAARWLVLLEAPASALQDFNPLDGDAGKLLDNMLRAAKLHTAASVLLAPLVRAGTGGDLPSALTGLLARAKADVVLVIGRLAAQALLQSTEPLPKLRGQIHTVQGQQTVITMEPTYLLRHPLEKTKVWDDLCLALSVVSVVSVVSVASAS